MERTLKRLRIPRYLPDLKNQNVWVMEPDRQAAYYKTSRESNSLGVSDEQPGLGNHC